MSDQGTGRQGDDPGIREPLSHKDARLLISKAWDEELDALERRLLSEHLSKCEECTAAKKRMKSLIDLLHDVLPQQPDSARPLQ